MPEYQRPTNEHELNRQLADTIGASVEQLLGHAGWSEANNHMVDPRSFAGQPGQGAGGEEHPGAAAPTSGPPAPAAPAAPVAPNTPTALPFDPESYKDANGKYLGKYDSVDQFLKGIGHAMNMAKEGFSARDEANARIAALTQELDTLRRQSPAPQVGVSQGDTVTPPTRGNVPAISPKVAEVLATYQEQPLDAEGMTTLMNAISEHAAEVARQTAREEAETAQRKAQAHKERWDRVDAYMGKNHPQSMQFTEELGVFVQAKPDIGRVVSALIKEDLCEQAMEYAWNQFRVEHGVTESSQPKPFTPAPATRENVEKEIRLDAADQVRREAVENARRDAGVIQSMAGGAHGVHESPNTGPTHEEYTRAVALDRQGNGQPLRAIMFRDILNHPLFN